MKHVFPVFVGLLCITLSACTPSTNDPTRPLTVVATVYPLAHFAEQAGNGSVDVTSIIPAGTEPHDFEPTPRDIASIYEADVFLLNGAGLDDWALDIAEEARAKGIEVLVMEDVLNFMPTGEDQEHEEDDHEEEEHGPLDPHFWLDPQKASAATLEIAELLAKTSPGQASTYRTAAAAYEQMLLALDEDYAQGLASCASRSAIVSHDAFGYVAARYNLELHPIAGLSTEEEPSAKQMGNLVTLARRENIGVVFFESLVSPRLAEVLASELDLQTLALNPLEGLTAEELSAGATYLTVMRQSLTNLRQGLRCP